MITETPYQKTVLSNGVRVVTERHPVDRAVSVGFWVSRGSRDEHGDLAGVTHFVEHLVFKRTKKRTAFQIARALEAVGGELNAYTSREYTCFVSHTLKEDLELAIDVLSDLVCRATFDGEDFVKEKQVVMQEIHMADDQLEDLIFDLYFQKTFGQHPVGRSILGSAESLETMKRGDVASFYKNNYVGENLIVSVAGSVEHQQVVDLVRRLVTGKVNQAHPLRRGKPKIKAFRDVVQKPSEQVHILYGLPAASFKDRLRFEGFIVNTLLGGGMTSKLYQSVRERRGLVYNISSQLTSFTDTGLCLIYAGTEPKHLFRVLEAVNKELKRLKQRGMTRAEIEFFKTQVKGQILLGADDIENRMNSLGVNEMIFGKYRSVDDVIADITAVNMDTIHEYLDTYFDLDRLGLLLMGPVDDGVKSRLESLE